ncbi:MAG: hypothetical protein ACE5HQ_12095 [Gemmatimonadota bacterium]
MIRAIILRDPFAYHSPIPPICDMVQYDGEGAASKPGVNRMTTKLVGEADAVHLSGVLPAPRSRVFAIRGVLKPEPEGERIGNPEIHAP